MMNINTEFLQLNITATVPHSCDIICSLVHVAGNNVSVPRSNGWEVEVGSAWHFWPSRHLAHPAPHGGGRVSKQAPSSRQNCHRDRRQYWHWQGDGDRAVPSRDVEKAAQAVKDIRRVTKNGELIVRQLDLASFASIRR